MSTTSAPQPSSSRLGRMLARLSSSQDPDSRGRLLLIICILLFACNLRAPMTSLAPLLTQIQESFGLNAATAGTITAIPLLVFGIVSPLAPLLARRVGLERALVGALVLILLGVAVRSAGSLALLFAGTAAIGIGIAIGNVLLPSLLKRDFPGQIAVLTSVYALTMGTVAAFSSSIAIPLADLTGLGWRFALLCTGVIPAISLICWLPLARRPRTDKVASPAANQTRTPVWRHAISWQVTFFLGMNSFLFYSVMSWLPAIMHDAGYSPAAAGTAHGIMQFGASIIGLLMMPIVRRSADQRKLAVAISALSLVSLAGLWLFPSWSTFWATLFGMGNGGVFILALSFMGTRVSTAGQAASLSGMAQSAGYLLACTGPSLLGSIHDLSGNWSMPLLVCCLLSATLIYAGWCAGRSIRISADGQLVPIPPAESKR